MKRFLAVAVLAAAMVCALSAPSSAAPRVAKHHRNAARVMVANATCPVSDPSKCPIPCRPGAASATVASAAAGATTAGACPVSDPSKCPASCRNTTGAATLAANVVKH